MYNDSDRIVEFPALKAAQEKLDAKRKSLADVLTESGPDYDMAKVKSIAGDSRAKVAAIGSMNAEIDECKQKVDELLVVARAAGAAKADEAKGTGTEHGSENGNGPEIKGRTTLGDAFVKSVAFRDFKSGSQSGPQATLEGINLKTLFETGLDGGAGWAPQSIRTGTVIESAQRPAPMVVNYFPQTQTQMASVVYMEETTYVNAAAEAHEGGTYGEAQLQLTERSMQVRKVAVFLPVTDESFEDEARARDYVNNRLPFMIRQRVDLQLLQGDGSAPNLLGTQNVVGTNAVALGVDSIPDAIYKGARLIRSVGFAEPNVVFIHPSKWEAVRLLKTADGIYIWGHPSMPGPYTIWGIPVVETTAVTSTNAVLGDYANFSEVSIRRGLDVQVSNSHSTFFVEGKLAIRADVRLAALHYRASAFSVISGL